MIQLIAFLMMFSTPATSAIPGLKGYYTSNMEAAQINSVANYPIPAKLSGCQSQLSNMTKDGVLSIYVAIGYLDFSAGQDFTSSENSLYTIGEVLDPDASAAFDVLLRQACATIGFSKSAKTTACNFSKSGSTYSKNITDRFTGKTTKIKIKIVSAAYSSDDKKNRTTYASQQNQMSQNAETQFLSALQNYDAVIYLGHARSGGGPDFYPPQLLKNGKVDYAHYKKTQPGITKTLQALNATNGPSVLPVLACKSTGLFASSLQQYASNSLIITANNLFDFDDLIPTGMTTLEALTSQRCGNDFNNVIKSHLPNNFLSFYN